MLFNEDISSCMQLNSASQFILISRNHFSLCQFPLEELLRFHTYVGVDSAEGGLRFRVHLSTTVHAIGE